MLNSETNDTKAESEVFKNYASTSYLGNVTKMAISLPKDTNKFTMIMIQ